MTTSFKSILRDSNVSLKLVEKSSIPDIKVFEITIPNPKKLCFYQVWNERTPMSNALPFKTFVLNPSLFVAALDTFTAANPDVFYYPTIVMEIKEKLYYVQAINFSMNENNDFVIQVTQDGFVTQRYQDRLENMTGVDVVINISKIPCIVLFNVLKEQNFVDWLDCTYDKMGPPNTICKSNCSKNGENEFNSNYQGNVTIKPFKNNMSIISLDDPGDIMIYSIWDENDDQNNRPSGAMLFPISIAEFYEIQKTYNQKVKSRHLSMDEYAFRPSVVITLKDNTGKSVDYLAVLEDITTNFESNLKNTDSQFSFIMSTQKFQGYPNLAMPKLPTGNFKINMNIDAISNPAAIKCTITGTTPPIGTTPPDPFNNYGFTDYKLELFNGSDPNPIFILSSLNYYLGSSEGSVIAKQNGNAFNQSGGNEIRMGFLSGSESGTWDEYIQSNNFVVGDSYYGGSQSQNLSSNQENASWNFSCLTNPNQQQNNPSWSQKSFWVAQLITPLYQYLAPTYESGKPGNLGLPSFYYSYRGTPADLPGVPLAPGDGPVS